MITKVAYVLGAGFSAPLGLPLMSNFLVKSKDLYFAEPKRYGHFADVFDAINKMSVAKNYFTADMFNIEEILSILEMDSFVAGGSFSASFQQYICDTIDGLTPPMKPHGEQLPGNWHDWIYGGAPWRDYGYFVGAICNLVFQRDQVRGRGEVVTCKRAGRATTEYALVTLNYDRVLEAIPEFIERHYNVEGPIGFRRPTGSDSDDLRPLLSKLHGSVELGAVVPPTWSKGSHSSIVPEWAAALNALREANHIRVIGYSLPTNDAYVRYLLKAASVGSAHMKSVDVINLDPSGEAKLRYDDFISFNYYRYVVASTEDYLKAIAERVVKKGPGELERAHESFVVSRVVK